jgi:hypothetical protein
VNTLGLVVALVLVVGCGKTTPATQVAPPPQVEASGPPLFVVKVGGKEGFIDRDGGIVIEPIFQKAYPFHDGLAAVQVKGLWGFIDTKGRVVIEPRFIQVGFFSEGLASFRDKTFSDPWGYIDKTGEVRIQQDFDVAGLFRNGIARVGFTTAKSKIILKFADVGQEFNYRFIDKNGKFVPSPSPTHYATGKAEELILVTRNGLVGYVDANGAVVIEPQFEAGSAFSDGLACVRQKGLFGYIDKTGKWVIPPRFEYSSNFSEGLAGVPLGKNGWGFIDRSGKPVIPGKFTWVYRGFRHGLAQVAFNGKLGYINTKGEWIWQPSD